MTYAAFLWGLIWAGMFTGLYNATAILMHKSTLNYIQGARAFLPLAAVYLGLVWLLAKRPKFQFVGNPIGYLFGYCFIGLASSLFLSPQPVSSMYWLGLYAAPILVVWYCLDKTESRAYLRLLMRINYIFFFLLVLIIMPESLRVGWGNLPPFQQYTLPFGLGTQRTNGAGRFALVVLIVCVVRFLLVKNRWRWIWPVFGLAAFFLLLQTQSRTSLLGLAVTALLLILLLGLDWRYAFIGPLMAAGAYFSGFQMRAHGQMNRLVDLTGRQYTWQKGLDQILQSPFLGWGFNADRILLNAEHMHNSFLHAAIHTGVLGVFFFAATFISLWALVIRTRLFVRARHFSGPDKPFLFESILIAGFLTARGFFESTGAFYGVDLLLLVPAVAFIGIMARRETDQPAAGEEEKAL
ncbi:MAG: O-antigen ligase family protein [Acidobacteriota bacterium]|nr:O-antigen ligase family protein [Acidobacteriota bacterium]